MSLLAAAEMVGPSSDANVNVNVNDGSIIISDPTLFSFFGTWVATLQRQLYRNLGASSSPTPTPTQSPFAIACISAACAWVVWRVVVRCWVGLVGRRDSEEEEGDVPEMRVEWPEVSDFQPGPRKRSRGREAEGWGTAEGRRERQGPSSACLGILLGGGGGSSFQSNGKV